MQRKSRESPVQMFVSLILRHLAPVYEQTQANELRKSEDWATKRHNAPERA